MFGTVTNDPPAGARRKAPPLPMTRGRRLALAIGVPVCVALAGWTGLSLVGLVGEGHFHVSDAIPVSARRVSVNFNAGNVALRQAAVGQGSLTGEATYALIRPHFTARVNAGGVDFSYPCDLPVGNCYLNATVTVPAGTAASIATGGGDATATGITGDTTLSTDGGNVTAAGTTGAVTMTTGGGDVTADRASGDLALNTDGGNIDATAVTAPVVMASTGGGDVTVVFTKVPRDVQISTDGGNITIMVPGGPAAYDLTTRAAGGSVGYTIPTNSASPNVITATSGGGDISVTRS
jgi:hypothetical protein